MHLSGDEARRRYSGDGGSDVAGNAAGSPAGNRAGVLPSAAAGDAPGALERGTRVLTVLTAVSRVTGLLRDAVLSRVFGAGAVTDAFFFAFIIPNLFRRLFGEGALSAAFLPVYAQLDRDDPVVARRLASLLIARMVVVLSSAVVIIELVLLLLLRMRGEEAALPLRLTMIMLPYMPMVCIVAILGAMLQVRGRFGPTATAPVVLNVLIIAAALIGAQWWRDDAARQVVLVSVSVLLAGLLQIAWCVRALGTRDICTLERHGANAPLRRVLRQAGPMIVGLGVLQLNTLLDGFIASYPTVVGDTIFGVTYPLTEGAMASVSFAQRLYQFPLGVFGIAIATAIFPLLARQSGDSAGFESTLRHGLRLVVYIGLPASAGLMLVRHELSVVVLRGGDFTDAHAQRVASVLLGYAPAIWAYSMTHVLARAFYALGDAMTPVRIACGVVALNLVLNLILIWQLEEAGLAWSTAFCAVLQTALLLVALARRTGFSLDAAVWRSWRRTAMATAAMVVVVLGVRAGIGAPQSWAGTLALLSVCVVAGAATCLLLGDRAELRRLLTRR